MLSTVTKRSDVPQTLSAFYYRRICRTAAVQGLGRINSEAIKILTPLLPIRPLVEYVIGELGVLCFVECPYPTLLFEAILRFETGISPFHRPYIAFHFPTAIRILLLILSSENVVK